MLVLEESPDRLVVQASPWKGRRRLLLAPLLGLGGYGLGAYLGQVFVGALFGVLFTLYLSLDAAFSAIVTLTLDRAKNRVRIVEETFYGVLKWNAALDQVVRADWVESVQTKFALSDWMAASRWGTFSYGLVPPGHDPTDGLIAHAYEAVLVMRDDSRKVVFGQWIADSDKEAVIAAVDEFLGEPPPPIPPR